MAAQSLPEDPQFEELQQLWQQLTPADRETLLNHAINLVATGRGLA